MNIVILGAGVVGTHIAEILAMRNYDVTVVDHDAKLIARIQSRVDVQCVIGNILNHEVLMNAEVDKADLLLCVTDNDEANIVASTLSKSLGASKVITRICNKNLLEEWGNVYESLFQIDLVLDPEQLSAEEIAKRIGTAGFYVLKSLQHSNLAFKEWTISKASPYINLPLRELEGFEDIVIPVIFRNNEVLMPSGNDILQPKDRFIMVGDIDSISSISVKLKSEKSPTRNIMIYGGTSIGYALAKTLENTRLSVKLVEDNEDVCKKLSEILNTTLILNDTCLDEEFLLQQNIGDIDLFVAVTFDEEDNLIASLMAKELGAKETIVLSERQEYVDIMKRLGVDTTISPRLIMANKLLQFLDPGPLKPLIILQENIAEVVEVSIAESSILVGVSVMAASFPKGMVLAALIRDGKTVVPRGDLIFHAGDSVIICTLNQHLNYIKKTFQE